MRSTYEGMEEKGHNSKLRL